MISMLSTKNKLRYFAVVSEKEKIGYALDYYPNEKRAYQREQGSLIIGDFDTPKEALAAVRRRFGLKMLEDESDDE
jgi:hypothetical protein